MKIAAPKLVFVRVQKQQEIKIYVYKPNILALELCHYFQRVALCQTSQILDHKSQENIPAYSGVSLLLPVLCPTHVTGDPRVGAAGLGARLQDTPAYYT